MNIALIVNGTPYQNRFLEEQEFKYLYNDVIHIRTLSSYDLSCYDTILLSCRLDIQLLKQHRQIFLNFLKQGKRLVIFGEVLDQWFPHIHWEDSEVNFSWWVRPNGDLPLSPDYQTHSLYEYLKVDDMKWHYHGTFAPPNGAKSLLNTPDGRSIFYIDDINFNGELIVTSLDPMFHIGLGFINQAKPFLHGLGQWLRTGDNQ